MRVNKSIKNIVLAAVTTGVLMVPAVNAQPMGDRFGDSPKMAKKMLKHMKRKLDLTDEQVAQIKAIREQSKVDGETLREAKKAFHEQVITLKDSATFDEAAFVSAYNQYQQTFADMALLKAKTRHAIYHVLTEEQQAKMEEMKEKRAERKAEKRASRES